MENLVLNRIISDLSTQYAKELRKTLNRGRILELRKFNALTIAELNRFAKMISDLSIGIDEFSKEVDITPLELQIVRVYYKLIEIDYDKSYSAFLSLVNSARKKIVFKAISNAQLKYYDENKPIDLNKPIDQIYLSESTYNFIKRNIVVEDGETITLRHLIEAFKLSLSKRVNRKGPKCVEIEKLIAASGYNESYSTCDIDVDERYEFLKKLLKQIEKEQDDLNKRHMQVLLELEEIKEKRFL